MKSNEYRRLLKKHHLCRECKQQDVYTLTGRTSCFKCSEKERLRRERRGISPRMSGICYQCNKKPCIEGKKLCQECYDKKVIVAMKNLEKAREKQRTQLID